MDSSTLFSTVAQVSFTITGLLLVAVASDEVTREYWFQNLAHKFFVNLNFISLFSPGLAALFSLISPVNINWTPTWPLSFFLFGIIDLFFGIDSLIRKYKKRENNEFRKLCDHYWNPHNDLLIDSALFIAVAYWGFVLHVTKQITSLNPEMLAGVVLCISILTGAFNVLAIFKPHPVDKELASGPQPDEAIQLPMIKNKSSYQSAKPIVFTLWVLSILSILFFWNINKQKKK